MSIKVSDLATQCHQLLTANPGPAGRAKVADRLTEVLADPTNIDTLIPPEIRQELIK